MLDCHTPTDLRSEKEVFTMYVGYVFVCNLDSLKNCIKNKTYSCSGEQVNIARQIETNAIVFLYIMESDTLIGPFTVVDERRSNLQPGTWTSSIDRNSLSGNIQLEWEDLRELKNAQQKLSFSIDLSTCNLSQFQIQEMLNALKEAPRLQTIK